MTIPSGYYGSVPQRLPGYVIGGAVDASYLDSVGTLVNADPQAKQVYTIVIDTVTNSATYTFYVNGIAVSYTADSSTSAAEIGAGLIAAAEADPNVYGLFSFSFDTATITATAQSFGTDILIYDTDAKLTTTETVAPADAAEVPFGRGVLNLQTFGSNTETPYGSLVYAAKLQAMVQTLTVAYTSGKAYEVIIGVDGQEYIIYVVAATDLATLTTALVTDINGYMPANTVLASSGAAGTVTLTAEVPGKAFTVAMGAQTTAANMSIAQTTVGPLTDINRCFAGVALSNYTQPGTVVGQSQSSYVANQAMGVINRGRVAVYSEQTVTTADKVYVETAAGADSGKFFNTSSATRLILSGAKWQPRVAFDSSNINVIVLA